MARNGPLWLRRLLNLARLSSLPSVSVALVGGNGVSLQPSNVVEGGDTSSLLINPAHDLKGHDASGASAVGEWLCHLISRSDLMARLNGRARPAGRLTWTGPRLDSCPALPHAPVMTRPKSRS